MVIPEHDVNSIQHIFIVGAKSIGQYGGYETFISRLIDEHKNVQNIKYHIACKANGIGYMNEGKLSHIKVLKRNSTGEIIEFEYNNAHVFKIHCPNIGASVAIIYDKVAIEYCIDYCISNQIENPIFYILSCRIGLFFGNISRRIEHIGGRIFLNPDGHEWLRTKWTKPIRKYWKWSEKRMINYADLIICDSINIEKYVQKEYKHHNTTYIAYGGSLSQSLIPDDDPLFLSWLNKYMISIGDYYLVVGRLVPENNYETIIREFMNCDSKRNLVLITNDNNKFLYNLEKKLHFKEDNRIKFADSIYDAELLKKIRENAYGYIHGHEVGGTNPSLIEALCSTDINLVIDVEFNREVCLESVIYWNKVNGNLTNVIDMVEKMEIQKRIEYGELAKKRVEDAYTWKFVGERYLDVFLEERSENTDGQ